MYATYAMLVRPSLYGVGDALLLLVTTKVFMYVLLLLLVCVVSIYVQSSLHQHWHQHWHLSKEEEEPTPFPNPPSLPPTTKSNPRLYTEHAFPFQPILYPIHFNQTHPLIFFSCYTVTTTRTKPQSVPVASRTVVATRNHSLQTSTSWRFNQAAQS